MIQNYKKIQKNVHTAFFNAKERDDMITKYAYLVKFLAGRVAMRVPQSVIFDELLSAGSMGLIDAVDKYNPEKNVGFKTYAQHRIRGTILDELRNMDWYSRSMRKKIQTIEKATHSIESEHKRPAQDIEIAEKLGISIEDYFKMLSGIHSVALLSLDDYIRNSDNETSSTSRFSLSVKGKDIPSENILKKELKTVLVEAIKKLPEKEQMVISLYYYNELTLKEIGNVLDLTESRICQIHTMALIKLQSILKDYKKC